jgi:hypothetical protein
MVTVVESDANDLAGTTNRRPQTYCGRDARSQRKVGLQPIAKSLHATSREECLVIIRHEIRDIPTGVVVEEDSRPFSASFAESNKFQGFTLATRA